MILGVNKKDNLKIQQHDNLRSQKGFTLIELMVVLSITAVLGILGIAGFTKYNQAQVLQTSVNNLTTTLNLARSRAASQVKPSTSFCIGQLDGYSVNISIENSKYTLNVVCGDVDSTNALQTTTLPKDIIFDPATNTTRVFFPVLSGKVEGAGTIKLLGYGQTKTIVVSEIGIFASAAIPTLAPTPTLTPTPTLIPTLTPTSTPIPTPTLVPGPPPIPPSAAYKRVFVTIATYGGNLGGLGGADKKCRDSAAAFNLGGDWAAWLSTSLPLVHAKDRIPDAEYRRLDNVIVANNKADLIDDDIDNAIYINENNTAVSSSKQHIWTGTDESGNAYFDNNCSQWGSESRTAVKGYLYSSDKKWTNEGVNYTCAENISFIDFGSRLYCFEK